MSFSIVVSAGTYHFGFDRLMAWTESWLARNPDATAVVQHGTSRPVRGAENHDILPHGELLEHYARASALVLQGGAGGIMDARSLGIVPIVVPRVPLDNEVVDDHQIVFAHRLRELGIVTVAESESELHAALDAARSGALQLRPESAAPTPGQQAVAEALTDLLQRPPARRRRARRVLQVLRPRR